MWLPMYELEIGLLFFGLFFSTGKQGYLILAGIMFKANFIQKPSNFIFFCVLSYFILLVVTWKTSVGFPK